VQKAIHTIIQILNPIKLYCQREYGDRLDCLILFGSQARGEANLDSDVDLLIVLQDPVMISQEMQKTSLFIANFCLENNLVISRIFLPKLRFENENSPLLRNIRREGIIL
jgi:predicted nucleotidyltransferase